MRLERYRVCQTSQKEYTGEKGLEPLSLLLDAEAD